MSTEKAQAILSDLGSSEKVGSAAAEQQAQAPAQNEITSTLQRAVVLEQHRAVYNSPPIVAPLRIKRRHMAAVALPASAPTAPTNVPMTLQYTRVSPLEKVLDQLKARAVKVLGLPTCLSVHAKFVLIGTTRGYVLVFDHFQNLLFTLVNELLGAINTGVSALDISCDGDHIIAGHTDGKMVWFFSTRVCDKHLFYLRLLIIIILTYFLPPSSSSSSSSSASTSSSSSSSSVYFSLFLSPCTAAGVVGYDE